MMQHMKAVKETRAAADILIQMHSGKIKPRKGTVCTSLISFVLSTMIFNVQNKKSTRPQLLLYSSKYYLYRCIVPVQHLCRR